MFSLFWLCLGCVAGSASANLIFSAGFSDDAVFQRSTDGAMVYGFVDGES